MPALDRLFLHIGLAKTGTKTLQLAMELNRDLLRAQGFVYPSLPGQRHLGLALYAANDEATCRMRARLGLADRDRFAAFVEAFPAALAAAVAVPGAHSAILSNEQCSAFLSTVSEIARLHRLLSPLARELRVILYLRRQDELAVSRYSSVIQSGGAGTFEFEGPHWFDYLQLLDRWAEVFGPDNLVVRVFEPAQMHRNDLLADFSAAIGFEIYEQLQRPPRQNESLGVDALEFLRRFNAQLPVLSQGQLNPNRGEIVQAMCEISSRDRLTPCADAAAAFLDTYAAANATVAQKYLGRADGVLFTEAPSRDRPVRLPSLDVDRAVEIAAKLWQWQERRIQQPDPRE